MKVSLIMATINRVDVIGDFIKSLLLQSHQNFELIIVDQNEHNQVKKLLESYQDEKLKIKYIKSEPGLSKSRNAGLKYASGDIVGFPDDDCVYKFDTLEKVVNAFAYKPEYHLLTGKCEDENGDVSVAKFNHKSCDINKTNVWNCGVSVTLFVRKEVFKIVSGFDEHIGAGSGTLFGSGEETDFILNCLEANFKGHYEENIVVVHPNPLTEYNERSFKRAYLYGAGYTKVLSKHRYPIYKLGEALIRPLVATFIYFLNKNKRKYYYYLFKGRITGLLFK